jgi:hypothetical protein
VRRRRWLSGFDCVAAWHHCVSQLPWDHVCYFRTCLFHFTWETWHILIWCMFGETMLFSHFSDDRVVWKQVTPRASLETSNTINQLEHKVTDSHLFLS